MEAESVSSASGCSMFLDVAPPLSDKPAKLNLVAHKVGGKVETRDICPVAELQQFRCAEGNRALIDEPAVQVCNTHD